MGLLKIDQAKSDILSHTDLLVASDVEKLGQNAGALGFSPGASAIGFKFIK